METPGVVTPTRGLRALSAILSFAVVVLAVRTAYLTFRYFSMADVARFQVESTAVWFVIAVLVLAGVKTDRRATPEILLQQCQGEPAVWILVWIAGAFVLFWPTLTIGFLSDDFTLAARASTFTLGWFNPEAFRPLPLAVWGLLLRLGAGPVVLHALNIGLHGTNACLTSRIVGPLARSRRTGHVAGLVVLTLPIVVEPVAWCSGIFDALATTFVLLAVIAGRTYDGDSGSRARLYGFCLAGLLTKETAVVAPVLVAIDAWIRRSRSRRLYIDLVVISVAMAVVGIVRLALASAGMRRPLSKYLVQRWVFGTVGGLATPWHIEVIRAHPWAVSLFAWMVIALAVLFATRVAAGSSRRLFYAMGAWTLIGTVPAISFFFVAPDLQSSRYLYLASIGWAGLLAAMAGEGRFSDIAPATSLVIVAGVIAFGGYGVRRHIGPWREAAAARDAFLRAAREDPRLQACPSVAIRNPPDSVRGAYVLRNGAVEALERDTGRAGQDAPAGCGFTWNPATGTFK